MATPPSIRMVLIACGLMIPSLLLAQSILLSEIMYNPGGPEAHTEYVELFNNSPDPVDLTDWELSDGTGTDVLIAAPGSTVILPAGGYAVILDSGYWTDGEGWYDDDLPDDVVLLTTGDSALGSGGLANSESEPVQLLDRFGLVIDERTYQPGADGGISEERIYPEGGSIDANWSFSAPGGSIGQRNTVTPPDHDLGLFNLNLTVDFRDSLSYIDYRLRFENRGARSSEPRILRMFTRAPGENSESQVNSWSISALPIAGGTDINGTEGPFSFGPHAVRFTLSPEDDNPANDTLRGEIDLPWPNNLLRVNELFPAPEAENPSSAEWVEVQNISIQPVPLAGWMLRDGSGTTGMLPETAPILAPDSFVVFAEDETILAWPELAPSQVVIVSPWPRLNNDADEVHLLEPYGTLVDSTSYLDPTPGYSLMRYIYPDEPDREPTWFTTPADIRATPGHDNLNGLTQMELGVDSVHVVHYRDDPQRGTSSRLRARIINHGFFGGELTECEVRIRPDARPDSVFHTRRQWQGPQGGATEWIEVAIVPDALPVGWATWTVELLLEDDIAENNTLDVREYVPWRDQPFQICEIMPIPPTDLQVEWVEIVNTSPWPVSPTGTTLNDPSSGYTVLLHQGARTLAPGSVAVLTEDRMALIDNVDIDAAVVFAVDGWPSLNNDGDHLSLVDPAGFLIDDVYYDDATHGESLVRVQYDGSVFDPDNWMPGVVHGQPGEIEWDPDDPPWHTGDDDDDDPDDPIDPYEPSDPPVVLHGPVTLDPNPFDPTDAAAPTFHFDFEDPGATVLVTLRIYTSTGRLVGTPLRDVAVPAQSSWRWRSSADPSPGSLPLGLYVYHVDAHSADSDRRWEVKGAFATTGR